MKVLIHGSCVSRDVLDYAEAAGLYQFELANYFARSSFASSCHPKVGCDKWSENLKSPFQRKIVNADIKKSFLTDLHNAKYDVILIDFIDDRFDLFVAKEDSILTISTEIINAGFSPDAEEGRIIKSGSEEFFLLWEHGWSRFFNAAKELGIQNKIRINRVYWAALREDGAEVWPNASSPQGGVAMANIFLDRLYERVERDVGADNFLKFDKDIFVCGLNHRWGISPFHFADSYYSKASELLKRSSQG